MKRLKLFVMFVLLTISSIFSQTVFQKSINGTILKDGQPFFINGIYHVSWYSTQAQKVADMQVIGNAGFNCVHASYDDVASTTAMLNEAQSKGVYVILEGAIYGTPKQVDVSKINALKGHPALLGWNLGDDVHDNTTTTQLSAFHTQIKQLDPNHITVFTVYNKSLWNSYFGIGDYIMPYSYPIGAGDPMGWVDHQLTASRQQAILTGSSIIAIPQAYSWNGNQSGAPTAVQYRNMVYQNLINNVKGILPYTFTESGQTSNYLPSWTSLWNEVKSMNQEVNVLKNIYLNGAYTRANTGYAEGSSENVHAAYWVLNNETYIVVVNVNETGGNISASISLPQASGTLTSVFAGKPSGMTFNNTTKLLTGSVSPRDVHVYKIAAGAGSSDVILEKWTGIGSATTISSIPLSTTPNSTSTLTSLEIPSNTGEQYGVRIRGYIIPTTTGSYTFYAAGDDNTEFYLSSNDQSANLGTRIAYHTDWTNPRQWNKFPSTQTSAPRSLNAGEKYYFEALMKEGGGNDNLAIGWTGPGINTITVIGAANLDRFVPSGGGGGGNFPIITARGENQPNEGKEKAFDLNNNSKWLDFNSTSFLQIQYASPIVYNQYTIVSGNDAPERDPKNWSIQGSNNGTNWVTLSTQTNQIWTSRNQARTFTFSNTTAYSYYKLDISANVSGTILQLSELTYGTNNSTPPSTQSGTAFRWFGNTSSTSDANKTADPLLNDNSISTTVWLKGGAVYSGDIANAYEAAGLIFSTAKDISSFEFVNGAYGGGSADGAFGSELKIQTTTNGTTWTDASGWSVSPAYSYGNASIGDATFVFTGSANSILGIRVTGKVRACTSGCSFEASTKELKATGTNTSGNSMISAPTAASINTPETGSEEVLVYPNPTRSNFTINNLKNRDVVNIVSVDGKLVFQRMATGKTLAVDGNGWGKGIYIINIKSNHKTITKKLVVE